MYLRPHRATHLQRVIALLATGLPPDELRGELARPLLGLLDADFYASYVWDEASGRFSRGVIVNGGATHRQLYEDRFQFDDPITPSLMAKRLPTRASDVISQRQLVSTRFFNEFLRPEGVYWGINAYAHDGRRHLGDFRVWRRRSRDDFDGEDIALMRLLYPALVSALRDEGPYDTSRAAASSDSTASRLVGRAGLSRREAEVAALAGEGLSDKEIARRLGIGFTTVRTHLAAVFRKLDCDGRARLAFRLSQIGNR